MFLSVVWLALVLPGNAAARWPTPAGGPSASGDPEVLFTFDDGPHGKHTPAVLDELAKRGATAIFFWVSWRLNHGDVAVNREIVLRTVREGHLVANHTINHPNLCTISEAEAAVEIDGNGAEFERATGLPMLLFRAPYGAHCKRLERMLADRSLEHIHWDIDPQEWRHHNTTRTANFIIITLKRLDGRAIVSLH
ncbi:MAG: polysaccharide deacetylase family protein, partial [Myxococcota bacterium]